MISNVSIKNFKSMKHLQLRPKRINIFIGEPNTGKSNILETLGMMSFGSYGQREELADFVRMEQPGNLFYDENWHDPVISQFGDKSLHITYGSERFTGLYHEGDKPLRGFSFTSQGSLSSFIPTQEMSSFKFYRFKTRTEFPREELDSLLPPSGSNLLTILRTNDEIRAVVAQILNPFGLRLGLRPQEHKVEVVKELQDVIISYPYSTTSDTLQRLVFYLAAVRSNKDSVIAFEEPEAHAFPYYTKYLAETIALDENNNQYFIATHNPYLLFPIIEKAPKEDVAVFVTYFENFQTKVRPLGEPTIQEIMDMDLDVFFNIDRLLEAE